MTAIKKQAEDDTDRTRDRELYEAYLRGKADMHAQLMRVFEEKRPGR